MDENNMNRASIHGATVDDDDINKFSSQGNDNNENDNADNNSIENPEDNNIQ